MKSEFAVILLAMAWGPACSGDDVAGGGSTSGGGSSTGPGSPGAETTPAGESDEGSPGEGTGSDGALDEGTSSTGVTSTGLVDEGTTSDETPGDGSTSEGTTGAEDQELCNGLDDDGDGLVDEGFDVDGDGIIRCCDPENRPFFATYDSTLSQIRAHVFDGVGAFDMEVVVEPDDDTGRIVGIADFVSGGGLDLLWRQNTMTGFAHRVTTCDGEWATTELGELDFPYSGGGDLDQDGCMDLVGWDLTSAPVSGPVFGDGNPALGISALGDCSGGFVEQYGSWDPSSALGQWSIRRSHNVVDATGDGFPDLVFQYYSSGGASTTQVRLVPGIGDGTFAPPVAAPSVTGQPQNDSALGDIDGDGCIDWVGGSDDDGNEGLLMVMHGDCSVGFSFGSPQPLVDVCAGSCGPDSNAGQGSVGLFDWDGDGDLDLLSQHTVTTDGVYEYMVNDGTGNFGMPVLVAEGRGWVTFPL